MQTQKAEESEKTINLNLTLLTITNTGQSRNI